MICMYTYIGKGFDFLCSSSAHTHTHIIHIRSESRLMREDIRSLLTRQAAVPFFLRVRTRCIFARIYFLLYYPFAWFINARVRSVTMILLLFSMCDMHVSRLWVIIRSCDAELAAVSVLFCLLLRCYLCLDNNFFYLLLAVFDIGSHAMKSLKLLEFESYNI